MVTAAAKRKAVSKRFGRIPVNSENLNWLYTRRHLGTVRDGAWRDLAYVVEYDNLEKLIRDTLDLIRRRDGVRVANEVRDRLADSIQAR